MYARLNAHAHIKEITKMKNKTMSASWLASLFLVFFCLPASVVLGDEYDHKVK